MNPSLSPSRLIALGILVLCALAVLIGVIQLVKTPSGLQSASEQTGLSGALLSGAGDRLASITLEGMIVEEIDQSSLFTPESSAVKARKMLYYSAKDPSVKGVLLRINSPGGTVGMSQELYQAVLAVRKKKPVVVSMGDVAASGGYYTAAAADHIVANPGTLTASIGVILQSINAQELLTNKLGIKAVTIKSGQYKDILSPYRPATAAELALLQHIIDTSYNQFLAAVLEGRTQGLKDPVKKADRMKRITAVADGRVVIGSDALAAGLVDSLGTLEDAKGILRKRAGEAFGIRHPEHLPIEEYSTPFTIWDIFSSEASSASHFLGGPQEYLPFSLRYANQPLWIMESRY